MSTNPKTPEGARGLSSTNPKTPEGARGLSKF